MGREADYCRHHKNWNTKWLSHPCEGDVLPVLQMRKLRPQWKPRMSWRQSGLDSGRLSAASLEDLLHVWDKRGAAETPTAQTPQFSWGTGPCSRVRLAPLQGLSQLPGFGAWLLPSRRKAASYLGLSPANEVFSLLCFCCSLRQTDGVRRLEKRWPE